MIFCSIFKQYFTDYELYSIIFNSFYIISPCLVPSNNVSFANSTHIAFRVGILDIKSLDCPFWAVLNV